jgi:DNA modification methylase
MIRSIYNPTYKGNKPITDFRFITVRTPLRMFNLNWRERDLPERERTKHVHRLHPYLGKFIPQLVEIFLRKYRPGIVYDPFCGSGTALVEANVLGIESIGCDISAFNCLLSKVKTDQYKIDILEKEIFDIIEKLSCLTDECPLFYRRISLNEIEDTDNTYLKTWFAERTRKELLYFRSLIKDYSYQDVLKIILSRAARSSRLTTHYELDFPNRPQTTSYDCHKHGRICQPTEEAFKFLKRYAIDTLERIRQFSQIRTNARVTIFHADSRTAQLPKKIDCVFTSPPYVGLIDYHEQHRYAYELLGLPLHEEKEIGRAKNGLSKKAREEYIQGINQVFENTKKYLTKDAKVIIVVNDKNQLYDAHRIGFREINAVERHVNRRTGRRNSDFFEKILIWKPNGK